MTKPIVRKRERQSAQSVTFHSPNSTFGDLRLHIEYRRPSELKPPRRALRRHDQASINSIEASIKEHGFLVPILVDSEPRIVAGFGRWLAATNLGLAAVPVISVTHLTEKQIRLFTMADNKLAEKSSWDLDELRLEFAELTDLNLDLNVELSGFSTTEIDNLVTFCAQIGETETEANSVPLIQKVPICKAGDIFALGPHKLICGSSLEASTFETLLGFERAQMVFADAPYNQRGSNISGMGQHKHADFQMASGEMSSVQFTDFLTTTCANAAAFSCDGAIHFQCMDHRNMREMLDAGYRAYTELKNLVVWKKHSAGMGTFYRSQHELIFVWKNGTAPHINNFGLGDTGRYRTNVWEYQGNSGFHKDRNAELAAHPTVKPWLMVADAIRDCSKRGGIVLDPFGGAGTTLIAAERTGRKARLIELDPLYCDVTIRRWQRCTGKSAVHIASGQSFAEMELAIAQRSAEEPDDFVGEAPDEEAN